MPDAYPLLLERFLSPRLWGGRRLLPFLGLDHPGGDEPIGESWQVYADNRIVNGVHAGRTLRELAARWGEGLLGREAVARYGREVPLLAKFIDAGERLSIQVHPDDAYARRVEGASGHLGKTEAWYILAAEPGASIVWGFRRPLSAAEVREAVARETLEAELNVVPVAAGDVVFNPAGTVHAVGRGIFLFEIQQSSDLTYRLYDYGRRGADGRLRELHLDKALDVARLEEGASAKLEPRPLAGGWRRLVEVEAFVMDALDLVGEARAQTRPSSLEIVTCSRGAVALESAGGEVTLPQGTSAVLPAVLGGYRLHGEGEVLRCFLPESPA